MVWMRYLSMGSIKKPRPVCTPAGVSVFPNSLTVSGVYTLANNNTVGNYGFEHGAKVEKRVTSQTLFLVFARLCFAYQLVNRPVGEA